MSGQQCMSLQGVRTGSMMPNPSGETSVSNTALTLHPQSTKYARWTVAPRGCISPSTLADCTLREGCLRTAGSLTHADGAAPSTPAYSDLSNSAISSAASADTSVSPANSTPDSFPSMDWYLCHIGFKHTSAIGSTAIDAIAYRATMQRALDLRLVCFAIVFPGSPITFPMLECMIVK